MSGSNVKGKIGAQDLNIGTGTFPRRNSTGGIETLSQVGSSKFPAGYGTVDPTINPGDNPVFSIRDAISGWTDVRAYGAKGDGVTDDTATIQSAIDAVGAAGGGIVYFPPGTYLLDTITTAAGNSWYLAVEYDNITLVGAGASSILKGNGAAAILHTHGGGKVSGMENYNDNDLFQSPGNFTTYTINACTTGGLSSVTCSTASEAGNFSAGDIVSIRCGQTITSASGEPEAELNEVLSASAVTGVINLKYMTTKPYIARNYPTGHADAGNPAPFGITNASAVVLHNLTIRDLKFYNENNSSNLIGSQMMNLRLENLDVEVDGWFQSQGNSRFVYANNNRITNIGTAAGAALTAATGSSDYVWTNNIITGEQGQAFLHIHEASANILAANNTITMKATGISQYPISIRGGAYNIRVLNNHINVAGAIATLIYADKGHGDYTDCPYGGIISGNTFIAPGLTAALEYYSIRVEAPSAGGWKIYNNDDLGWGSWVDEFSGNYLGQQDRFVITADRFNETLYGTGAYTTLEFVQTVWWACTFDPDNQGAVGFTFMLPRDWNGFDVYVYFVSKGTDTGDAVMTCSVGVADPEDVLPTWHSSWNQDFVVSATGVAYTLIRQKVNTSTLHRATIDPSSQLLTGQVARRGAHASDTLTDSCSVLAVEFRRTY